MSEKKQAIVYWSRRDFRLSDNPALSHAVRDAQESGGCVVPIFVLERYMTSGEARSNFGYPQRLFLTKALPAFASQFPLFTILSGNAVQAIGALMGELERSGYMPQVYVNEDVHPDFYTQIAKLREAGCAITVFPDQITIDSSTRTGTGNIYSVFTPFKNAVWKQFLDAPIVPPVDARKIRTIPESFFASLAGIIPAREDAVRAAFSDSRTFEVVGERRHTFDCAEITPRELKIEGWYTSEVEAERVFSDYLERGMAYYAARRDVLADTAGHPGTSRMSLAFTWGLLSARSVRERIQKKFGDDFLHVSSTHAPLELRAPAVFLTELVWREFYKYLLFHNPRLLNEEFQEKYRGTIEWVPDTLAIQRFTSWIRGETGYPIVDAAMMQIAEMGWMHNRARMVAASILTKNLGVDWRWGQEYFRAQLIDLDDASNNGGWQWAASVGADPKPIRIFNPYLQAQKFDPKDAYQKHWLTDRYGEKHDPIVPHAEARKEALRRYRLSSAYTERRGYGTRTFL